MERPRLVDREVRRRPVGQDGHVPGGDGVAGERGADRLAGGRARAPVRCSAIRSFAAATRAGPSSLAGPGSRSASAARTAFASPTRPSASYVAPIRRGSASTWISRPESSSAYCPVVSAPSSVPTARRTSAPPEELAHGRLVQRRPDRQRVVLGEGALAHVGRRHRRAQPLRDRAQLLPGARAEHAAAGPDDRRLGGRQAGGRPRRAPRRPGAGAPPGSRPAPRAGRRSPRRAGRRGSPRRRARSAASARGARPPPAAPGSPRRSRRAPPTSRPARRRPSGRAARAGSRGPAPIRSRGIWLAIATTGTCALAASISAASEMSAPGPVERRSGAGRPLVRA